MKKVLHAFLGLVNVVYQIIDRPMDFTTIKNQMEAKDGFKNAMKYNDEKSDVHVMTKVLLEKFEEEKREAEETEAQTNIHLAQEANYARLARDINNEVWSKAATTCFNSEKTLYDGQLTQM
ncbi:hypothetical protein F511_44940 [Dorcoceras hygrometricum]|uniref:Uncharacterized protein n=1 Tax=Dorcoceras hygrometricum TaxID=472368 RepID=A0A2Z7CFK9_9LAMI|nr:hypothetical protein F511_44940 [Dorcoceras hygrometricum]